MATEISLADSDIATQAVVQSVDVEHIDIPLEQDGLTEALSARVVSVLQTTLDLEQLFTLFSQQIRPAIPHLGLRYSHPANGVELFIGQVEGNQCVYHLLANLESVGELTIYRKWEMDARERRILEYTLRGLVYPLRNALLYRQALQAAHKDPLTGAFNRATFEETLDREIRLAQRHKNPLSMIVLDIDHFKKINDQFGHTAGDQILKCVCERTSNCVRVTDIVFRYGGEEFVILLSNTDNAGAVLLAERIREAVMRVQCVLGETSTQTTVSLGVGTLHDNEKREAFFNRVDHALYSAKNTGRNRVCSAD